MQTTKSEQYFKRAMEVLVEGCSSASRGPMNYKPFPPYMREGKGARIWDVDDNEYIDFVNSLASVTLGYCDKDVDNAVQANILSLFTENKALIPDRQI